MEGFVIWQKKLHTADIPLSPEPFTFDALNKQLKAKL